ncbi:hypothetical protein BKA67DRAFT_532340 [Truncatella angustata]|uniref:Uncharacterized protein n=1 Tax=Truncatella angustata TaxID=152316 RepID=A0A9P9A1F4_9PEZI|nr:uncharacterized protein BKA67DRAFT_532340 [Truncatella angustata]KAH6657111.1 hypothetical protein BKA67DRAFT_532340 [Truncatella angustata]
MSHCACLLGLGIVSSIHDLLATNPHARLQAKAPLVASSGLAPVCPLHRSSRTRNRASDFQSPGRDSAAFTQSEQCLGKVSTQPAIFVLRGAEVPQAHHPLVAENLPHALTLVCPYLDLAGSILGPGLASPLLRGLSWSAQSGVS